jgi:hypothetical protein
MSRELPSAVVLRSPATPNERGQPGESWKSATARASTKDRSDCLRRRPRGGDHGGQREAPRPLDRRNVKTPSGYCTAITAEPSCQPAPGLSPAEAPRVAKA